MILRWKALVKLATVALKALPTHHPAITPEFLAAICVVESGGDTFAVGDHGAAVGIAQFHPPTFYRFAERGSGDSRVTQERAAGEQGFHGPQRRGEIRRQ